MLALLFCLVLELRIAVVLWNVQTPTIAVVGLVMLHTWMIPPTCYDVEDVQIVLINLQHTRVLTHRHSATIKLLGVITSKQGASVHFQKPVLAAGGAPAPLASAQSYICLLGLHALPHVYHPEDFRMLLRASRRAGMVLRYARLPAHYPLLMYSAAAGGSHRWLKGIRPPSYTMMKILDFPPASVVRSVVGWVDVPAFLFMQPIRFGW